MSPFQSGDWICADSSCGYHNFARNNRCRRCNASRDQSPPLHAQDASDNAAPSRDSSPSDQVAPGMEILGAIEQVPVRMKLVEMNKQTKRTNWYYTPSRASDPNQGIVWQAEGQITDQVAQALSLRLESSQKALVGYMANFPPVAEAATWSADDLFLSSNGDVRADFSLCKTRMATEDYSFLATCFHIYGILDLQRGPSPDDHLLCPPTPDQGEMTPWRWLVAYQPGFIPDLLQDENMVAILNARGTAVMNAYFQGTPEQAMIVKLADTAVHLYNEWKATAHHPVSFYEGEDPSDNPAFRRYKLMVLALRDDIQTHMTRRLYRLTTAQGIAQLRAYDILQERIDTWRWYAARTIAADYAGECSHMDNERLLGTFERIWHEALQQKWRDCLQTYRKETAAYIAAVPDSLVEGLAKRVGRAEEEVVEVGRGELYYMGGVLQAGTGQPGFRNGARLRYESWVQDESGLWFPFE
ncbi:hypothetical protein K491DRAFT_715946 [Lophiostoma macrostomum CBS 122681]|uniref:RanBP2-type domain-containing protein n=1 Tax=Lophiostoma macrostomum CBS 122681 TaxID=1314788 RepID=A0A6A6T824_9PLEO|nr:hypothetical protein K491DRAFT_715946 [Lophiostoma macrostomum CBS 122681]